MVRASLPLRPPSSSTHTMWWWCNKSRNVGPNSDCSFSAMDTSKTSGMCLMWKFLVFFLFSPIIYNFFCCWCCCCLSSVRKFNRKTIFMQLNYFLFFVMCRESHMCWFAPRKGKETWTVSCKWNVITFCWREPDPPPNCPVQRSCCVQNSTSINIINLKFFWLFWPLLMGSLLCSFWVILQRWSQRVKNQFRSLFYQRQL